jgi:multisubunit Na+/H+ antiporter MnhB subunit
MLEILLDLALGGAIVWLAWSALHGSDLFRCVILFMAFGLLMSLMWARLGAPDIALAEAAIGAGLSGALLIAAVARLGADAARGDEAEAAKRPGVASRAVAALAAAGVATVGLLAAWRLDPSVGNLPQLVEAQLERSEVGHPVTAVLLNFRAYDTWLEVVVLLTALVAVQAVIAGGARPDARSATRSGGGTGALLPGVVRLLLPVMVLTGGYFLWRGTSAPGGAFQAGAVIGSAGVLAILTGWWTVDFARSRVLRLAASAGAVAFLLAAADSAVRNRSFLQLPPGAAGLVILMLEVAVTISIALTLAGLFAGSSSPGELTGPTLREPEGE